MATHNPHYDSAIIKLIPANGGVNKLLRPIEQDLITYLNNLMDTAEKSKTIDYNEFISALLINLLKAGADFCATAESLGILSSTETSALFEEFVRLRRIATARQILEEACHNETATTQSVPNESVVKDYIDSLIRDRENNDKTS